MQKTPVYKKNTNYSEKTSTIQTRKNKTKVDINILLNRVRLEEKHSKINKLKIYSVCLCVIAIFFITIS
tara:strand:+ start:449 stop:655 length:207 start_codon:yes stop_codon:yes gene_type:complete